MTKHRSPLPALVPVFLAAVIAGCASAPGREDPGTVSSPETEGYRKPATPLPLRADRPENYVVQRGDTLWSIAGRFLRDPWRWPELWHDNPRLRNPHQIFPGDMLSVVYIEGKPQMRVQRGGEVRLSPHVRVEELDRAIPAIRIDAIHQFLTNHRILDAGEYEKAPHVVGFADDHISGGSGDFIYVRSIESERPKQYQVLTKGPTYRSADKNEVLGYEAVNVGTAELVRPGELAKLRLRMTQREVVLDDRVLPTVDQGALGNFLPHPPVVPSTGHILGISDGLLRAGKFQVVAIDLGSRDGIDEGTVLQIEQAGDMARDQVRGEEVKLPDERLGLVMVFQVYKRVSYALVMEARNVIRVGDVILTPGG